MGQTIEINKTTTIGDMLIVDTDRSLTGQTGNSFVRDGDHGDFDGQLAARLFEADPAIDHVHVLSNTATIRRSGGWDDGAIATASELITRFFRFY